MIRLIKLNENAFVKRFCLFGIFFCIFSISIVSAVNIGVSPASISFKEVMRNGYAENFVVISADSTLPSKVSLNPRGEIADWLNFSQNDFNVSKGEPFNLKISVSPPAETPNGNYTGFLRILTEVSSEGVEGHAVGKITSSLDLKINVEVTDVEVISCKASNVEILSAEEGDAVLLKMDVLNEGNVLLKPTILIDIWDSEQARVVQSEEFLGESILPTVNGNLEFRIDSNKLDLGQYWSDVSVLECYDARTLTFDILEPGTLTAKGVLSGILTPKEIGVGDTMNIIASFKNTGEKEVEAKFQGEVTLGGKIVQLLESETFFVPVGENEDFNFYFTPQRAGKYVVSGRVFYSGKKTFELSSVFDAISNRTFISNLTMPLVYSFFMILIGVLVYKIRRERRIYATRLRSLR